jgi:HK97 family phage major capsid protein
MEKDQFESEVLKKIGSITEQNQQLIKNYDQLTADTKAAMENFTALKNSNADLDAKMRSMQRLNMQLKNERGSAFGDPIKAFARDREKALMLIAGMAKRLDVVGLCSKSVRDMATSKDLDTGAAPGSGYIANAEIDAEIYDMLLQFGAYRGLNVRMIGAKAQEVRIKTARAAMGFVDEAAAIGADSTKAGSKTMLTPKKIGGLISVSNELAEDDVTGVAEDILRDFLESAAYVLDWISFTADGTADATDGGFSGMFYGGTSRTAATGNVSVATLDVDDFINTMAAAPAAVLQRGAKWFIHPTFIAKSLLIKDLNGRSIFNTAIEAPSFGAMGTILGFPVAPVGVAPSTDGVTKKIAAFGDPEGQAVRIRRDLVIERSKDWAFDTDELTFRATLRAGSLTRAATAFQILTTAAS